MMMEKVDYEVDFLNFLWHCTLLIFWLVYIVNSKIFVVSVFSHRNFFTPLSFDWNDDHYDEFS